VLTLDKLSIGTRGKIIKIASEGEIRRRIMDMGLTTGAEFKVEAVAPLGDPIEISVRGYHLSLRKKEVADIYVEVI
jgi:ferrous iron transport protein A